MNNQQVRSDASQEKLTLGAIGLFLVVAIVRTTIWSVAAVFLAGSGKKSGSILAAPGYVDGSHRFPNHHHCDPAHPVSLVHIHQSFLGKDTKILTPEDQHLEVAHASRVSQRCHSLAQVIPP